MAAYSPQHTFCNTTDYAISVYKKRFPDAVALGDIGNIRGVDLPEGDRLFPGGFPCQDISIAGKHKGIAGERSGLWFEYARLIKEVRPEVCLIENVPQLAKQGLYEVLTYLAKRGMMRSEVIFGLPMLKRRTKENDSGLFPDPIATDWKHGVKRIHKNGKKHSPDFPIMP